MKATLYHRKKHICAFSEEQRSLKMSSASLIAFVRYYLFRPLQQIFPALVHPCLDVGDEVFFAWFEEMFETSLWS